MGKTGYPVYGEELGSAIEDIEKAIARIKTNVFDNDDLLSLAMNASKLAVSALDTISKNEG